MVQMWEGVGPVRLCLSADSFESEKRWRSDCICELCETVFAAHCTLHAVCCMPHCEIHPRTHYKRRPRPWRTLAPQ